MRKEGDPGKAWWPAPTRAEWLATLTPAEYEKRRWNLYELALEVEHQFAGGRRREQEYPTFAGYARAAGGDS